MIKDSKTTTNTKHTQGGGKSNTKTKTKDRRIKEIIKQYNLQNVLNLRIGCYKSI